MNGNRNKVFYDRKKNRLIYIKETASETFWDNYWKNRHHSFESYKTRPKWIINITKRFLKPHSNIIEGGCGIGDKVFWLEREGYNVVGVDFAEKTIKLLKKKHPELAVYKEDLRNLSFGDNYFDGYWSLGVIEHFYDGFEKIMKEMKRVLRKNGILFLTYPYMSPFRKIKTFLALYPIWTESLGNANFYQYAFDKNKISHIFENCGFKLLYQRPYDAYKGLIDDLGIIIRNKYLGGFINRILFPLTSHIYLQVYQNKK